MEPGNEGILETDIYLIITANIKMLDSGWASLIQHKLLNILHDLNLFFPKITSIAIDVTKH